MTNGEQIWLVYKATGKCGRGYIGITTMPMRGRKAAHKSAAKKGQKGPFYDAIRKYGYDHFSWEILTECYSSLEAIKCEQAMIAVHDTLYTKNGWNRNIGGGGNVHGHLQEETKKKISDAVIKRNAQNPEYRNLGAIAYNAMGRPVSEDGHKRKLEGLKSAHNATSYEKGAAKRRGRKQDSSCAHVSAENAAKGRVIYRHKCWTEDQYLRALANRIGYERPHRESWQQKNRITYFDKSRKSIPV